MKRLSRLIAALLLSIVAAAIWFTQIKGPDFVREKITAAATSNCPTCKIEMGRVKTPLFSPGRVVLEDVRFRSGTPGAAEIDLEVDKVVADISLAHSGQQNLHVKSIEVFKPVLVYTDGDGKEPPSAKKASAEPPRVLVEATRVRNGRITYVRNTKGTSAKILFHDIAMTVGTVDSKPADKEMPVDVTALLQIEKSGTIELDIKTAPFADVLLVDLDLRVRDQQLSDLTPFLKENAGVELSGHLKKGRARIRVRDKKESARVWAEYTGLNVKLHPMHDRTDFEAFVTKLGVDLTMSENNEEKPEEDQKRSVIYERKPGQSIVAFIVQGMKEAAIKVAQAN